MILEPFDNLIKAMVDFDDAVMVHYREFGNKVIVEIDADNRDKGKLIGRNGETAAALKRIISAVGHKTDGSKRYFLEIIV